MSTRSSDDYTGKDSSCSNSLRRAREDKRKQAILRDKMILECRLDRIELTLASIDGKLNQVLTARRSESIAPSMIESAPCPPPGIDQEHVSEIDAALLAIFSEFEDEAPEVTSHAMHINVPVQFFSTGAQTETLVHELQVAFLETKVDELCKKPEGKSESTQTLTASCACVGTQTDEAATASAMTRTSKPSAAEALVCNDQQVISNNARSTSAVL